MVSAVRRFDVARRATVRICDRAGKHHGQGLLLDIGEEAAIILTCHHVVAPLIADELCIAMRQDDGRYMTPRLVQYDSTRSRPSTDTVVLRAKGLRMAEQPFLHALNPAAYSGTLPGRATAITCWKTDTFDARVGATTTLEVPVEDPGTWPDPPRMYSLAPVYRLADPTDARPGISGSVVTYDDGVLGLAHFSRAAGPDQQREVYMVPLGLWADRWPALAERIQPFIDRRLQAEAIVRVSSALRLEEDIAIAGFRPDVYLRRPEADAALAAFSDRKTVMIVGRPKSGKTRMAWEILRQHPESLVVIPHSAEPPEEFDTSTFAGREVILLFDDLHRSALTYDPLAWQRRLTAATGDRVSLVCTSRDGEDWRTVCSTPRLVGLARPEACIFLSSGLEQGQDLSESLGLLLAAKLSMQESEFRCRFDGTPGSLTVDLNEMRDRYCRLREQYVGGVSKARLLDSAKLLYEASQPQIRVQALRAVAERIRDSHPLSPEVWEGLCRQTQEEGFGRISEADDRFQIYKPYLESCIAYEPRPDDLSQLVAILKDQKDAEGLSYLATALYSRTLAFEAAEQAIQARMELVGKNRFDEYTLVHIIAQQPGREKDVEEFYREKLRVGDKSWMEFGLFLKGQPGRESEAEHAFREAIRYGSKAHQAVGYANLGILFSGQPARWVEAEDAFRRALDGGVFLARTHLAELLVQQPGRERDAELEARQAVAELQGASSHDDTADDFTKSPFGQPSELTRGYLIRNYFVLVHVLERDPERTKDLEQAYRGAINLGAKEAANNLGALLARTDRFQEAEQLFRTAVDNGIETAHLNLALLIGTQPDRSQEAEILFRQAIRSGSKKAHLSYGRFLVAQGGREREAERAFRNATDAGAVQAYFDLGNLLSERPDRRTHAIEAYNTAIEKGISRAAYNLGLLLLNEPANKEGAKEAFRKVADSISPEEHLELAILLCKELELEGEAEEHFRAASEAGLPRADFCYGLYLCQKTGREKEGLERLRRAAEAGVEEAAKLLQLQFGSDFRDATGPSET